MKTYTIVRVGLAAALLAICAWISIPFAVPFTLQTFAVFLILIVLGGVEGTAAIAVYVALGAIGAPVFAGFTGGFSVLLGPTGGYILGFLIMGALKIFFDVAIKNPKLDVYCLAFGLVLCYIFGTLRFTAVMARRGSPYTFGSALLACVLPYVLPDAVKLALALFAGNRIKKALRLKK